MNEIVADMDDVDLQSGPSANGMNWLFHLKGKFPKFKITLFVIPGRSTWEWLDLFIHTRNPNKPCWIELALHGWNHKEGEPITQKMLDDWPYTQVYKGPNWSISLYDLELLKKNNYVLAVKEKIDFPIKQWSMTDSRCVHGHVWIDGDWKRLEDRIDKNTEFKFISEI